TLDSLISKYGCPKFCKIDVEGYELQVLKGLHQPLPLISLEYCVPEMTNDLIECISYLQHLSPNGIFNYSIGESMEWASKQWFNAESFKKLVNTQDFQNSLFGDIYFKNHYR
ncbi:MAG TPA: FkbM family methyltransferase, partial [Flavisolibacter sp.]|nr:FkbM family methyltransferase [Flavisolibacter sp.]